jgi:hypothetical protein
VEKRSAEETARALGTSKEKIAKIRAVKAWAEQSGDATEWAAMIAGTMTVNAAHEAVRKKRGPKTSGRPKKPKAEPLPPPPPRLAEPSRNGHQPFPIYGNGPTFTPREHMTQEEFLKDYQEFERLLLMKFHSYPADYRKEFCQRVLAGLAPFLYTSSK